MSTHGKQKATFPMEMFAASDTMPANVGKVKTSVKLVARPLLHRNRRRETVEKVLRKVELPGEVFLLVESF